MISRDKKFVFSLLLLLLLGYSNVTGQRKNNRSQFNIVGY